MPSANGKENQHAFVYLAGVGVTDSIASPMYNFVAQSLGYYWTFIAQECPTVQHVSKLFRAPTFAGGVVALPYNVSIMEHLDGVDEHVSLLKSCNIIYRAPDGSLRGTNTDWIGIKGCLESATMSGTCAEGRGKPALIIGAEAAAWVALYVLHRELGCRLIYVVSHDRREVDALLQDARGYIKGKKDQLTIVHLDTLERATAVLHVSGCPYYVIGTVPDFQPRSPPEFEVRSILEFVFQSAVSTKGNDKTPQGVLLDMCFIPRRTRTIKLAEKYGWTTVEGTGVVGHQIEEQYRLWSLGNHQGTVGTAVMTEEMKKGAWEVLNKAASDSKLINF